MNIESFQKYLEIAKDLGVTKFRIEGDLLSAEFGSTKRDDTPAKLDLKDLLGDMPSDRALLNLPDLPDDGAKTE